MGIPTKIIIVIIKKVNQYFTNIKILFKKLKILYINIQLNLNSLTFQK